ncbi:MAG: MBL fold metallo-hydrolase [Pseudomonadales bacterium]|nr:MBL fold metallo-hydrolase [Pseudomonadales bacterium]MBO6596264.1 MBL fold metallo-hydrolase [Pseudomonadales bacterium]MBO6656655.1 MBL fold metallo-hydrolase [Pseudomonadales bacterium]MBO6702875.1 MBL fold metallo-hydrolase [Pseudomonadales bacterium]MBO6822744.1 MBL fold metallo-hydrolase [Pseudomonadales bacterium]
MALQDELILEQIQIGPMQNFTYLVGSKATREVAVVDPAWDIKGLLNLIDERGYTLNSSLITHYHPDHCGGSFGQNNVEGVAELLEQRPVKSFVHKLEADGVKKVTGISDNDMVKVESGDTLKIGDIEVEFLHTPGHTPGSQCFKIKQTLVSGDTLFIDGCGRVDLPGSNSEDMYHSIQKLAALPDETLLLPGHNYSSVPHATMGDTKKHNTYMRIGDLETWKQLMGG